MAIVYQLLSATQRQIWLAFACFMVVFLAASWHGRLAAQEPPDAAAISQKFGEWNTALERIARDVNTLKLDEVQLETLSDQAVELRSQAVDFSDEIEVFANDARELRDAFSAATPGGAPETEETQAQAKELAARVAQFDGWIRQSHLIMARADQLLDRISAQRMAQLAKELAERGPLPINPFVWWRALGESWALVGFVAESLTEITQLWLQPNSETGIIATSVIGIAVAAWLVSVIGLRFVTRLPWPLLRSTFNGPVCRIILAAIAPALPWIAAGIAGSLAAPLKDWLPLAPGRAVVWALLSLLTILVANFWALSAALIRPPAGVPALAKDEADRLSFIRQYMILLSLFSIDTALHTLPSTFVGDNLQALWTLILVSSASYYGREAVTRVARALEHHGLANSKMMRLLLLTVPTAVAVVTIVASALGYANFAGYVITNSLASAVVCIATWALRHACQEIVQRVCDIESPVGKVLRDKLGADQPALRLTQFWLGIGLDIAVLVLTSMALMVAWGTGADDAILTMERLIEGVRVGNMTLSLADLVVAILTFMIGVWVTRFVQRLLEQRVFPGTQLDLGVRNSLRSGLGYIGVIIAGGFAILVLGIDLSNLALVAGALSVGIGFGLQNIINNFVSGLILLIERPVKVGDWISVGGNEGIIKRINVRSTEITTDARASVLVPNADFLGVSVTNWTHKDMGGRVHLTFQTPEELGAEGGRDLLIACAKAHPKVLSDPPIKVLLQEIGGGYTFELSADVADVMTMKEVCSDLRYSVDRALRSRKG